MPEPLLETWATRGVDNRAGRNGLTEPRRTCSVSRRQMHGEKAGWAGKALSGRRFAVLSEVVELPSVARNVFAGYWRNEAATAQRVRDGWLLTGDVAEAG